MTTSRPSGPLLPVVHEPAVMRCGHYVAEEIPGHEALVLSHLVTDLNAIEIAAAVNAMPGRRNAERLTPNVVRRSLHSLQERLRASTREQMVDVACRAKILLPPRTEPARPLPKTPLAHFQLRAQGWTSQEIAGYFGVTPATVTTYLADIRHRAGTRGNPAAVFRLHGVPGALDGSPNCPICASKGAA
ncbi:helix-turn-helix transcriptional regulator [Kitasatospora sp. NPDC127116]|uniref:helix-turn-helix transcriptional regulator n=1 Tax=Kitasatospora sp. NPDC127116 TaxID=3345367 RepID=UPI0036364287